jgi:hypothetical protein
VLTDGQVRRGGRFALHAVHGAAVAELDVLAHVVGGQDALAALARDGHRSVAVDAGDGPSVAVGDLDAEVIVAGDDPVAGTDACCMAGGDVRVVDPSAGDQPRSGGVIERADLLVGVRDDDRGSAHLVGVHGVPGQRANPVSIGGVDADLAAGKQGVEHCGGVVASAHGQAQLRSPRPAPSPKRRPR